MVKQREKLKACILALSGLHRWLEKFMNVEVPVADFLSIVMTLPHSLMLDIVINVFSDTEDQISFVLWSL